PSASWSKATVPTPRPTRRRTVAPPKPPAPPVTMADRPASSIRPPLPWFDPSPLGRAQPVDLRGVGVAVAAVGRGAVVHLPSGLVVDAAGELRLDGMRRRTRVALGLDPCVSRGVDAGLGGQAADTPVW